MTGFCRDLLSGLTIRFRGVAFHSSVVAFHFKLMAIVAALLTTSTIR